MSTALHLRVRRRAKPTLREQLHSIGAVLYLIAGYAAGIYFLGWLASLFVRSLTR